MPDPRLLIARQQAAWRAADRAFIETYRRLAPAPGQDDRGATQQAEKAAEDAFRAEMENTHGQ